MEKELHFVTREAWGAAEPKEESRIMENPISCVIVTQTDTEECATGEACVNTVRRLQERDMDTGLTDIRQNFLIGGDGRIYVGRGWEIEPPKHDSYDYLHGKSLEVSHIEIKGELPSEEKIKLVDKLVKWGSETGRLSQNTALMPVMD